MSIRMAFSPFRDGSWTGGLNYLRNLFSALAELPERPVVPVLFVAPDAPDSSWAPLLPYLLDEPVVVPSWGSGLAKRICRFGNLTLTQRDQEALSAYQKAGVEIIFRNEGWDGFACPLPILAWIPDFQHCHLSEITSTTERVKRDLKFSLYCRVATRVLVSSLDGQRDCEMFFKSSHGKVTAVPFAVDVGAMPPVEETQRVLQEYGLPERFCYFPGQLWRHKNHSVVVEALKILKVAGHSVTVISSGNLVDKRHPDHPKDLLATVEREGLSDNFRFLGLVPYGHIAHLMRASVAVLNPSLFEGWSTTVEEAKAMGSKMILSNLRVHREQAPDVGHFFDPKDASPLADLLLQAHQQWPAGPDLAREMCAFERYRGARQIFGQRFAQLAEQTLREGRF